MFLIFFDNYHVSVVYVAHARQPQHVIRRFLQVNIICMSANKFNVSDNSRKAVATIAYKTLDQISTSNKRENVRRFLKCWKLCDIMSSFCGLLELERGILFLKSEYLICIQVLKYRRFHLETRVNIGERGAKIIGQNFLDNQRTTHPKIR